MQLKKMTDAEFKTYIETIYTGYADEQVRAGTWQAEHALELSRAEINELLPNGLQTQDHFLYSLIVPDESSPVGALWIMVRTRNDRKEVFIDDIVIYDHFRRKGYGEQALKALEAIVIEMGIHTIRLQVFGHNHEAIHLYQKSGFEMINIYMEKQV